MHYRKKASCIDISARVIHILSTGYKFYVFVMLFFFLLVLINVKMLFDFKQDKLEQSNVTLWEPRGSSKLPFLFEAFHLFKPFLFFFVFVFVTAALVPPKGVPSPPTSFNSNLMLLSVSRSHTFFFSFVMSIVFEIQLCVLTFHCIY